MAKTGGTAIPRRGLRRVLGPAALITLSGTLLGFLVQVALTRSLGIEVFGVYAFVYAWIMFLGRLTPLGFTNSLLRLTPAYLLENQFALLHGLLKEAHWSAFIAGISGAVLLPLFLWFTGAVGTADLDALFLMMLALPIWSVVQIRAHAVRAFGHTISALTSLSITMHSAMLVSLGTAYLFHLRVGLFQAAIFLILSMSVNLCAISFNYIRTRPLDLAKTNPETHRREWWRLSLAVFTTSIGQQIISQIGLLLIGFFAQSDDVARFAVAHRLSLLASMPLTILVTVISPEVSRRFAAGDKVGLRRLYVYSTRIVQAGVIVSAVGIGLLAEPILAIFGKEFTGGTPVLLILLAGQVTHSLFGPVALFLTMTRFERPLIPVSYAVALVGAALTTILILYWGAIGAAVGSALSITVYKFVCALILRRKLGLHLFTR